MALLNCTKHLEGDYVIATITLESSGDEPEQAEQLAAHISTCCVKRQLETVNELFALMYTNAEYGSSTLTNTVECFDDLNISISIEAIRSIPMEVLEMVAAELIEVAHCCVTNYYIMEAFVALFAVLPPSVVVRGYYEL
jgi:hypothetical protein